MSKFSYKNDLPKELWYSSIIIPLHSSIGEELFSKSFHRSYDKLIPYFEGQEYISYCGIACASTLLNSLCILEKKWTQSIIYTNIAQKLMLNGITLENLSKVLEICGLKSIIQYCENENFEEEFRKDLQNENNLIIVNYWRQYKYKDHDYIHRSGHFSLIGGYNQIDDCILILDPSHTKFPHHWLSLQHLVRMMCTYDGMSNMPRGYLIINFTK